MRSISNNEVAELIGTPFPRKNKTFLGIHPVLWQGPATQSLGNLNDFKYLKLDQVRRTYGVNGYGVTVYVLDTGCDIQHPVFNGKTIPYKSFVKETTDADGHGTWVCGKLSGLTVGIAPGCTLKVCQILDATGTGSDDVLTSALHWILNEGDADIVNLSLGSFVYSQEQEHLCERLSEEGVLVVAAGGNYDSDVAYYPAAYDSVTAVSAFDDKDKKASFSDYGPYISFSAPGVALTSSFLNNTYRQLSGTSMATPLVSSVMALGLSLLNLKRFNGNRRNAVLQSLASTAFDFGNQQKDPVFGYGGINCLGFLSALNDL